ncbi:MATE family efflux transporter [Granulicella mallensis]|uniref:Multidrug-efflux transporter n=1 Tax=Granulicella mallensis TaxID=940614 RepID=A0A7W8EB05_9BACT|nr:MATE family efflux transporter [Granulicella mallensis]MBB5064040.1 MATE family multidrug resistance protein [Granulicella mallensis]
MRSTDIRRELPLLLKLALPLIVGELGWVAMSLVDTIMVGRLPHSAIAMSAGALAQVLFNTLVFGIGGILLALDTLISQAFGAKEMQQANRWLLHGLVMAVLLSGVLMTLFAAGPTLLMYMPVDRAVLAQAVPAMWGLNYGTLPLLLYFTLRRYLQAMHHGRPIAFALISANLVNIAGDWLMMFGHRWQILGHTIAIPAFGVEGSAWSTSFARLYLMAVLLFAVLWADQQGDYGLRTVSRRIEVQHLRKLFVLGAPAGASLLIEIAIFALVTSLVATMGPLALAGHEVALQCASTTFMVPLAISSATAVRVGHAVGRIRTGAATIAQAALAGWCGIGLGAAFMLVAAVVFLTIPAAVARLFTPDQDVIHAAVPLLFVAAGFQFFDGVQITATGALRGAGNTTAPLYTQVLCYWAIGMPLGVLLAFRAHLGAAGLWWGLLIALTAAALMLLALWHRTTKSLAQTMRRPQQASGM